MILTAIGVVCLLHVAVGQPNTAPCCWQQSQVEMDVQQIQSQQVGEGEAMVEVMRGRMAVDYRLQRLGFDMTVYIPAAGRTEVPMRVVVDATEGMEYIITKTIPQTCVKIPVRIPIRNQCVFNGTYMNEVKLGEGLVGDTWRLGTPDTLETYVTVSRNSCLPIHDVMYGSFKFGDVTLKMMINQQFSNVKGLITDRSVLEKPANCPMGALPTPPPSNGGISQYTQDNIHYLIIMTVAVLLSVIT